MDEGSGEEGALYSRDIGLLADQVAGFKAAYARLWYGADGGTSWPDQTYKRSEQKRRARQFSELIDESVARLESCPQDEERRRQWAQEFTADLKESGVKLFDHSDLYLDSLTSEGFVRSTREFIYRAWTFDPEYSLESITQALRNVWIMNALQIYFDRDIQCDDAVFAYSMLYPYTDNCFDSAMEPKRKAILINKLRTWLEGRLSPPDNPEEEKLSRLIGMIGTQYPRTDFPELHQSLLAIFNAQIRSLLQQKGPAIPYEMDLLDISFEKGGTSVLADGYLVSGRMTEPNADFCFGFGAFLQLADDLQDVAEDRGNRHMTIFSQIAGHYPLDGLVDRLLRFIPVVVDGKLESGSRQADRMRELIVKNCLLLITEAVGQNRRFFSRKYTDTLQLHFPVRFADLSRLRKKIRKKLYHNRDVQSEVGLLTSVLVGAVMEVSHGPSTDFNQRDG